MPKVIRVFHCCYCNDMAYIDNLTDFMSLVECDKCSITEILNHHEAGALEHFKATDVPYQEEMLN